MTSNVSERVVAVADGSPESFAAAEFQGHMGVPQALTFTPVSFRYFTAEHTLNDRAVIIHFFVSDKLKAAWDIKQLEYWWLNTFAATLSVVAKEHFKADAPRIVAKYTPEVASWWFKAQGYGHLLDLAAYLDAFFLRLDDTLHDALLAASAPHAGRV